MDLIATITNITGQVLRRIADGIDGPPANSRDVHIHIATVNVMAPEAAAKSPRFPRLPGR